MTRETKIGLLVGLAFIIVIGILLSDHFRSTMEPPQAMLSQAGTTARSGVTAPGTGNPPITFVTPKDAPPPQQVPTQSELTPRVSPVIPSHPQQTTDGTHQGASGQQTLPDQPTVTQQTTPDTSGPVAGADGPGVGQVDPRIAEGNRHGVDIVPVDPAPAASLKPYKAQSGDTLSRLAARFLGTNNKANRQAIIDANPSLQDDPDTIVLGKTYMIPTKPAVASATPATPTTPDTRSPKAPVASEHTYTVVAGDTLWGIATNELGDAGDVDALKELNKDVLKGTNHDVVRVGMKLRLPSKPIASAN